jgi:hypothetical protein
MAVENNTVRPGIYKHFKGDLYEVIGEALHSETLEPMVVYKHVYGNDQGLWVRPVSMWNELVKKDGVMVARFSWVRERY